jgi:hypothetical protein
MSLSRRERREFAKKLGLLGRKENYEGMMERFRRSKTAGDFLHTHHLQEVKNIQLDQERSEEDYQNSPSEQEEINPFGFLGKR